MKSYFSYSVALMMMILLFAACQKEDAQKDYGASLIYMPQSINVSQGLTANYMVPTSSNGLSTEGMNYVPDESGRRTNIILGVALSGKAAGSYSVDIIVDTDTVQQMITSGILGADYLAMPSSVYTLPGKIDIGESGSGTFYLSVDNSVITNPAYRGKRLVLAVRLINPSRYELNEERATTIIIFNISGMLPDIRETSEYNVEEGDVIVVTGQNLDKITEVKFAGSTISVAIKNQSATSLTLQMPSMGEFSRAPLEHTSFVGSQTTAFELVNVAKAYKIFTDDFGAGIRTLSTALNEWVDYGTTKAISTTNFKRGTASLAITTKDYSPGGLIREDGFVNDNFQYITFWARTARAGWSDGGIAVTLMADGMPEGYGNDYNGVELGPRVTEKWTYYKIPIGATAPKPMWSTGNSFLRLGWRMNNYNAPEETIYYDDVLLVK